MSNKEVPKPVACDDHEQTRHTAFHYLTDEQCQKQYNAELEFSQAHDHVHACIHKDVEKECNEGSVAKKSEFFQECGRTYGCYDLKELSEN